MTDVQQWPFVGREAQLATCRRSLADPDTRGLIFAGGRELGRSRTAAECARIAVDAGYALVTASGRHGEVGIPFGALADLLPGIESGRTVSPQQDFELFQRLAAAVPARAAGHRGVVLLVDDAHLLDGLSATLVYQMAVTSSAFILATVHSGSAAPDPIVSLWKNGLIERQELNALSRAAIGDLLLAVLGGPVDPATTLALASRCDGNVLFLRELVAGALEDRSLRNENGMWCLVEALRPSTRLTEIVEARLHGLTDRERELL